MQEMSRRNQHFTDSVIRRMTRISNECGAINLAQGFPDFDPPKEMMDRLEVVSHEGPHQYPITMGAPNFRQAIARKCGHFMGRTIDPETEIVATIGSTEAMVDTLFALTNPRRDVLPVLRKLPRTGHHGRLRAGLCPSESADVLL